MVKNTITKFKNFALMVGLLPFVYGCSGGSDSLASLFGGASVGTSLTGDAAAAAGSLGSTVGGALASSGGGVVGGALPSLHNPEPATMLLLGSGFVAMGIFKKIKK